MTKIERILTIVIPAYNVENYIVQCLDSVIYQTVSNCKIIIINDGSTDHTADICQQYASDYPNMITYVYQDNKGLGAARNTGLSLVDTPYVSFLDSDDWQDIRFVEKITELLDSLDYEPDMIFTLPHCFDMASHLIYDWMDCSMHESIFKNQHEREYKVINGQNCPQLYMLEVNANRKVYRTDFLREQNFVFPEGVKWEDIRPHMQLVHEAKYCVGISDTGFIYRTNASGQITAENGKGRLDMIPVMQDTLEYVNSHEYEKEELAYILLVICKYVLWTIDMTNTFYIGELLAGFHSIFVTLSVEIETAFADAEYIGQEEKNKCLGLIDCLKRERYMQLANYEERALVLDYWSKNGPRKSNIVSGGIQCIKDSGLRYTIRLLLMRLMKREI